MEEELEEVVTGLQWTKPFYKLDDNVFIPSIYEGSSPLFSKKFNSVTIQIDGRMQADLSWKQECIKAREWVEKGYHLFWEIELGLFSRLAFPLTHQSQYLSLGLSLDHFRDVIWKEFGSHSLGISIYRGFADFSLDFVWNESQVTNLRAWLKEIFQNEQKFKQETGLQAVSLDTIEPNFLSNSLSGKRLLSFFCRDVALEYIGLLTNRLSDSIPRYLLLDVNSVSSDPLWQAQLLNPELFEQISVALKGHTIPLEGLGWEKSSPIGYIGHEPQETIKQKEGTIGICLPSSSMSLPSQYAGLEAALRELTDKNMPFRIIAESQLITNWDGLDYLLFVPSGLSVQGKRKLQGFCAAGGIGVTLGSTIGLTQEIPIASFFATVSSHGQV